MSTFGAYGPRIKKTPLKTFTEAIDDPNYDPDNPDPNYEYESPGVKDIADILGTLVEDMKNLGFV